MEEKTGNGLSAGNVQARMRGRRVRTELAQKRAAALSAALGALVAASAFASAADAAKDTEASVEAAEEVRQNWCSFNHCFACRLYSQLLDNEKMPDNATDTVQNQIQELRKVAAKRLILVVLDGGYPADLLFESHFHL